MSRPSPIDDADHVLRDVKPSHLRRDGENRVVGVDFSAFQLRDATATRPKEEYLSAAWCEYYSSDEPGENIRLAAAALCSCRDIRPSAGFAHARVGDLKQILTGTRYKLRVLHEEEPDMPCHAALRHWPARDETELLELVAAEAWATVFTRKDLEL